MRGFVFIIEAVLASILLVSFMLFLSGTLNNNSSDIGISFHNILPELDQRELLRPYIDSNNIEGLNQQISVPGYSHKIAVCDGSGCTEGPPEKERIWSSSYFLSGSSGIDPKEVKLYVWEA